MKMKCGVSITNLMFINDKMQILQAKPNQIKAKQIFFLYIIHYKNHFFHRISIPNIVSGIKIMSFDNLLYKESIPNGQNKR